jgi:hypothetical protein
MLARIEGLRDAGQASPPGADPTTESLLLRKAGALLVGGFVLEFIAELLHPSKAHPNNHVAVFTEYAKSDSFTAVHILQFAAILVGIAGLLVLYRALALRREAPVLAGLAAAASVATAASFAVLQAIDGVALKHAVDAWLRASGPEKSQRFASAETVRWLEWGANSYFRFLLGLSLILFGVAIMRSLIVPRWLGGSAAVAGVFFLVVGVLVGEDGFGHGQAGVGLAAFVFYLVFSIGLFVVGWRGRSAVTSTDRPA